MGSEMCIRDRSTTALKPTVAPADAATAAAAAKGLLGAAPQAATAAAAAKLTAALLLLPRIGLPPKKKIRIIRLRRCTIN